MRTSWSRFCNSRLIQSLVSDSTNFSILSIRSPVLKIFSETWKMVNRNSAIQVNADENKIIGQNFNTIVSSANRSSFCAFWNTFRSRLVMIFNEWKTLLENSSWHNSSQELLAFFELMLESAILIIPAKTNWGRSTWRIRCAVPRNQMSPIKITFHKKWAFVIYTCDKIFMLTIYRNLLIVFLSTLKYLFQSQLILKSGLLPWRSQNYFNVVKSYNHSFSIKEEIATSSLNLMQFEETSE